MKLSQIYRANQCTDLNDVDIAISQTKELLISLRNTDKPVKAAVNRLLSLEKKRSKIETKEIMANPQILRDKFGAAITDGSLLSVQNIKKPIRVYKKKNGNLYFSPYGKESKVTSYFSNDLILI